MKQTKILMGMPVTVEIIDKKIKKTNLDEIFNYFTYIDNTFSTYKKNSEVSKINRNEIVKKEYSKDMKTILSLAKKTKQETHGYFDVFHSGTLDPSGIVKGWAIWQAAKLLEKKGFVNFYIDAGGDMQIKGKNGKGEKWSVGIKNPFNQKEIVKVLAITNKGIATSGTYIRGQHIYNPKNKIAAVSGLAMTSRNPLVSLTVIGPNVYDADRFATAAFAMGEKGIAFIENLFGFEGYMIDKNGVATYTSEFEKYVKNFR